MREKIHVTNGTKYSKMGQGKILECILKADDTPFFKGCLPQILHGSFLNTLSQIILVHLLIFCSRCIKNAVY